MISFTTPNELNKKIELQKIIDQYLPSNSEVLSDYPEQFIDLMADSDSLQDYALKLPTIVHEAYHFYSSSHLQRPSEQREYRLNDSLTVTITELRTFPAKKINKITADSIQVRIFRYGTYIDTDLETHDTQQNGFLGLLEEYTAYYQEFKTYNALYDFLKDKYGFSNPILWQSYLCDIGSVRYALDEFEIFTQLYLRTAKSDYPDIYQAIVTDENINTLLACLIAENHILKEKYHSNREMIFQETKGQLILEGEWLRCKETKKGIHDSQARLTKNILNEILK